MMKKKRIYFKNVRASSPYFLGGYGDGVGGERARERGRERERGRGRERERKNR